MKITKLEIECTEEERSALRHVNKVGCVNCESCAVRSFPNWACHVTDAELTFKITRPPLRLYEGMDCSKLQTREGHKVIAVIKSGSCFFCVFRGDDGVVRHVDVKEDGWEFGNERGPYDIIWKEDA